MGIFRPAAFGSWEMIGDISNVVTSAYISYVVSKKTGDLPSGYLTWDFMVV